MSPLTPPSQDINLKDEMRRALAAYAAGPGSNPHGTTSDLSMDEELNLHSIGWEPVEFVGGFSAFSTPSLTWSWGQGEIGAASYAHEQAFDLALARLHQEAAAAGGHGVVGVQVTRSIHQSHTEVSLMGTAVRPVGAAAVDPQRVFTSDLSARDFTLLMVAGWEPLGLAAGASFVFAPRRSMGTVLSQQSQNVELTNFTEAMYNARETAMERMQSKALAMKGTGVVDVKVFEGPMYFASHAVGFTSWGTVVRLRADEHRHITPTVVVPLDDAVVAFEAATLGEV